MSNISEASLERLAFIGESATIKFDFWFDLAEFENQEDVDDMLESCDRGDFTMWVQDILEPMVMAAQEAFFNSNDKSSSITSERPLGVCLDIDIAYDGHH
jgi:hypothetical protein